MLDLLSSLRLHGAGVHIRDDTPKFHQYVNEVFVLDFRNLHLQGGCRWSILWLQKPRIYCQRVLLAKVTLTGIKNISRMDSVF